MATRRSRSKRSGGAIISVAIAVFILAGIAISGSSAGYGLAVPAAVASFLIYRRTVAGRIAKGWWAALAAFAILFALAGLQGPLGKEAFEADMTSQPTSRRVLAATTVEIIEDSFPVGTGLGTFSTVYRRYEDPSRVTRQFANHAHNDYLEAVLELGLAGILLILGFLFWWATAVLSGLDPRLSGGRARPRRLGDDRNRPRPLDRRLSDPDRRDRRHLRSGLRADGAAGAATRPHEAAEEETSEPLRHIEAA